jgi:type IV pilus assembly protein PilM
MPKQLNIEIEDSFIKVISTEKNRNGVRLEKAFMFKTPAGTVADGVITDPVLLGNGFTQQLHENGFSGIKNVSFTITSNKVATRDVMLPAVKESRIKPIVESNAGDYFPVDVSRYLISYGMLKTVTDGNEAGSHVMVMAVPLQILDGYLKLAEKMNLEIQAIDYGGNCQFQIIKALKTKKVTMCITVGFNHTYITIVKDDRMILQRMLSWGGSDGSDKEEVARSIERIAGGVSRSMDFFNSNRWSAPIENVILAGSCASYPGLREAVSAALNGTEVLLLEEFAAASVFTSNTGLISQYISAYGNAFAPIDLLPDKYKATKEKKKSSQNGIIGAVAVFATCLIAGGTMSIFSLVQHNGLLKERDALRVEVAQAEEFVIEHGDYRSYRQAVASFTELHKTIESKNEELAGFFNELEQKLPSDLLLLSAVCTNEGVLMNIRATSFESAAKTISALRSFESVEEIEASDITEGFDELGMLFYSFSVNCLYERPAAPVERERDIIDKLMDGDYEQEQEKEED